ncbi:MAG: phosphate ABC transporter permease PstA [Bacillota bacterium]|nr:phosphate ABC transporter permease PstA [Bacillota bacterium]
MSRKTRDKLISAVTVVAAFISAATLLVIIGFILKTGLPVLSPDFLTGEYNPKTSYLDIKKAPRAFIAEKTADGDIFIREFGITLKQTKDKEGKTAFTVTGIKSGSPALEATDAAHNKRPLKTGSVITKIGKTGTEGLSIPAAADLFKNAGDKLRIKAVIPGGGIYPMIIATLLTILLSLGIVMPVGVCAAIYLVEYARGGRVIEIIRFATECLSGIPSILFGLFGMLFFVKYLNIGQSILAGSLTLSILLLPTVIRTTEETLKTIPQSYKEGSYGLGASKLQTLCRIVLPGALPGILVAVILSTGRIVGESAALLFTAGTFANTPKSVLDSAATMTVRAYVEVKEYGNVNMACGIGVILIAIVLTLNLSSRFILNRLNEKRRDRA